MPAGMTPVGCGIIHFVVKGCFKALHRRCLCVCVCVCRGGAAGYAYANDYHEYMKDLLSQAMVLPQKNQLWEVFLIMKG